jgi:S-methyl-5-thioribose-1-phosphate isomerase
MIDQRFLPFRFSIMDCPTHRHTAQAIKDMTVRGAGAIGVAAGFALAQAAMEARDSSYQHDIEQAAGLIRKTRPTARDLFYAVERVHEAVRRASSAEEARRLSVEIAQRLSDEDAEACRQIGLVGEPLIKANARILTQCNAGWLAFSDWGSALSPVYTAHRKGKNPFVYVPETRPRGQGARLTAWELGQENVSHVLVADTACGFLFSRKEIDCVIVGADRIAANGDTANKIGTYTLAVLAREHKIPFYVAAPRSTFDSAAQNGDSIVIEERGEEEVLFVMGKADDGSIQRVRVCADKTHAKNPAFDITPASFIRAFITQDGLIAPTPERIATFFACQ